jgi:phospholipase/carboxylesterase
VHVTRRGLLLACLVAWLAACTGDPSGRPARGPGSGRTGPTGPPTAGPSQDPLRLTARPDPHAPHELPPGTHPLPLHTGRTGLLHVPPGQVRALVVVLHGAGGTAEHGLSLLRAPADARGLALLAPASAGSTWDAITGPGRRDTSALDAALQDVLARLPLPVGGLAVAGFSDGASYALTLGLSNGDLLRRVVAFSPGFSAARQRRGEPELLITHGTQDEVLPIERTSRRVVSALRGQGYAVDYRVFPGGHGVPPELAEQAAQWLVR